MTPSINAGLTAEAEAAPTKFLQRCAASVISFWYYPVLRRWAARVSLLLVIAAFCAVRAYVGLRGTQSYSHDAFMLLDGAWRMMNGQRPHIDFYSHVGVLTFAPTLLGLWMSHGLPAAFAYGQAVTGAVLGIWAYLLSRTFLNDVPGVLMSLAVTLMTVAPSVLGFQPLMVGPAMTYNRFGYAVWGLILIEVFARSGKPSGRYALLGGISTGLALGILLFLKITFFVFAVIFIAAMIPFRAHVKARWIGIAVALIALLLLGSTYFSFNLRPMVGDLFTVAASKHLNLQWYAYDVIVQGAGTMVALALTAGWLLLTYNQRESARLLVIGTLVISCIAVLLILGNYEESGFPLAAFLSIIILDTVTSRIPHSRVSSDIWQALVLFLGSVFIFVFLLTNIATLTYSVAVRHLKATKVPGLASPILSTFIPVDGDRVYAAFADDGLALVQQYRHSGESIMSLDFTNPFSYGLGAKPAPGGNTVMQYKTTFNDKHKQSPESLFGSADLVAIPRPGKFSDDSLDYSIVRIYGGYLEQHFDLIGQSKDWKLYRRRTSS